MKTRIENSLHVSKAPPPRRRTASWLFLPIYIAMMAAVLAGAPRLRADEHNGIFDELDDFEEFANNNGTNDIGANDDGAVPYGEVVLTLFGVPLQPHASPGGSPSPDGLSKAASSDSSSPGAGTLYGTASLGGSSGQGTVFVINTDGTNFTVLHNFIGSDGTDPQAGLLLSSNTLYGTTVNGGNSDEGTVFAVITNGTGFKVLHHFTARPFPYTNTDGGNPYAALILSGNTLYGTTLDGGSGNAGTVFALNIINTNFTVLHHFAAANYDANFNLTNNDGANPYARLILSGGTLYGTASSGGSGGQGTVFAVNTNGSGFTNLHSFTAVDPLTLTNRDGTDPQAGLILSGNTLYGTAFRGGNSTLGTVFSLNTNSTGFTNLYSFTGGSDGAEPAGELALSTNTLFGTTFTGGNTSGSGGMGTVFSLNTDGTDFTVLHNFTAEAYDSDSNLTNSDGANPRAGLVFSDNTLYGTASQGGGGGNGTVFSLALLPAPQLTILGITLSGTNLVIHGANGQSGETNVTLMSTNPLTQLNQWTPVATNVLNASGDFTFTATNAVSPAAPRRFYILRTQ